MASETVLIVSGGAPSNVTVRASGQSGTQQLIFKIPSLNGYGTTSSSPGYATYSTTAFTLTAVKSSASTFKDYVFKGWYTVPSEYIVQDHFPTTDEASSLITTDATISGSMIVATPRVIVGDVYYRIAYPKFAIMAKVSFSPNGGTGTMEDMLVDPNSMVSLPSNQFSRDEYNFAGWSTSSTGGVEYPDGGRIYITGDTALYAVWRKKLKCVLVFNSNGGYIYDGMTQAEVDAGSKISSVMAVLPSASRDGYSFAGWYYSDSPSTEVTVDDIISTNPTIAYAKWIKNIIPQQNNLLMYDSTSGLLIFDGV